MKLRFPCSSSVCCGVLLTLLALCPRALQAQFAASYVEPPPELLDYATVIRDMGVVEEVLAEVNGALRMPRQVPVVFDACGQPNAFYSAEDKAVVFCYEFLALFDEMFSQLDMSDEEVFESTVGATVFFLLHEIGHALVDVLEIPITGREEDAVDDLAALILIEVEAQDDLLTAADAFDLLAIQVEESGEEPSYWDEHSLSVQRAYAMACVLFGSDPEEYAELVDPELLPEERARRCPAEFEQKSRSWDQLLDRWLTGAP